MRKRMNLRREFGDTFYAYFVHISIKKDRKIVEVVKKLLISQIFW